MGIEHNDEFQAIVVGKLLEEGITCYVEHGAVDFWGGSAGIYTIYIKNPSKEELDNIQKGKVTLGLMPIKFGDKDSKPKNLNDAKQRFHKFIDTTFIFFKFGNMPWLEAPFNMNLCLDEETKEEGFKKPEEGMGYSMQIVVVNAANGIVEGIRVFACPREFCLKLMELTRYQIETTKTIGFNKEEYDKWIFKLYDQYTTDELAMRCKKYDVKYEM